MAYTNCRNGSIMCILLLPNSLCSRLRDKIGCNHIITSSWNQICVIVNDIGCGESQDHPLVFWKRANGGEGWDWEQIDGSLCIIVISWLFMIIHYSYIFTASEKERKGRNVCKSANMTCCNVLWCDFLGKWVGLIRRRVHLMLMMKVWWNEWHNLFLLKTTDFPG